MVYSSFWLEYKLWGLQPAGYHAVNIVLHLLNCLLLWRLLLRIAVPGALLIAAGLLSKSVVVTLTLTLLIVQWWWRGEVKRVDLLRVAPLVVIGVAITAADLAFYRGREVLELGYTLAERMLIAGAGAVWPVELALALWLLRERIGRGPVGGGAVLRADAGAGAGVRGLRLPAVFVRGGPVPVPGFATRFKRFWTGRPERVRQPRFLQCQR